MIIRVFVGLMWLGGALYIYNLAPPDTPRNSRFWFALIGPPIVIGAAIVASIDHQSLLKGVTE